MQNWQDGGVKITNNELKRFLEDKLGQEIRNGYQVTSFANDFEKIFAERVTATKTRNALSLSWSKGVCEGPNYIIRKIPNFQRDAIGVVF
jgi:hypothetical protein